MAEGSDDIPFKVVMVGAKMAGKTTIVRAWAEVNLSESYLPTLEKKTYKIMVKGATKRFLIYADDIYGEEKEEQAEKYLQGADGVVLVYDHTHHFDTVKALKEVWLPRMARACPDAAHMLVQNRGLGIYGALAEEHFVCEDRDLFGRLNKFKAADQLTEGLEGFQKSAAMALKHLMECLFLRYQNSLPPDKRLAWELDPDQYKIDEESRCEKCMNCITRCLCLCKKSPSS